MQVTLRRASALQNAIRQLINGIHLVDTFEISALADLPKTVEVKRGEILARYTRKRELTKALYTLRGAIAKANAEAGINDLLTRVAYTQSMIELQAPFAEAKVREDAELLERRAKRQAALPEANAYGRSHSEIMHVAVLQESDVKAANDELKALRLQKTNLADQLAELNAKTCISMDEATAEVLRAEGLI